MMNLKKHKVVYKIKGGTWENKTNIWHRDIQHVVCQNSINLRMCQNSGSVIVRGMDLYDC